MAFKLNQNADINGTSSRGTIPDITAEMMQQVFGDPVWGEGYGLGLGSKEWYFVSDDGQVVRAYDMGSTDRRKSTYHSNTGQPAVNTGVSRFRLDIEW
jgi:hypothetical protein